MTVTVHKKLSNGVLDPVMTGFEHDPDFSHDGGLATAQLNFVGQPTDGQTVTIGARVYTFQDTLTDVDGNVKIGATMDDSLGNLSAAVGANPGGVGTQFAASTVEHADVAVVGHPGGQLNFEAKVLGTDANSITVSTTVTGAFWTHATFTGGAFIIFYVKAGKASKNGGTVLNIDPTALHLIASATNKIYLDFDDESVQTTTGAVPSFGLLLFTADVDVTVVNSFAEFRTPFSEPAPLDPDDAEENTVDVTTDSGDILTVNPERDDRYLVYAVTTDNTGTEQIIEFNRFGGSLDTARLNRQKNIIVVCLRVQPNGADTLRVRAGTNSNNQGSALRDITAKDAAGTILGTFDATDGILLTTLNDYVTLEYNGLEWGVRLDKSQYSGPGPTTSSGSTSPFDRNSSSDQIGHLATGVLTFSGQPTDGEAVVINGRSYTFQDTLTDTSGNVQIEATLADTISNLAHAINLGSGAGTAYAASTTPNLYVSAVNDSTTLTLTALRAGDTANAFTTTDSVTNASWGAATLTGGIDVLFALIGGSVSAPNGRVTTLSNTSIELPFVNASNLVCVNSYGHFEVGRNDYPVGCVPLWVVHVSIDGEIDSVKDVRTGSMVLPAVAGDTETFVLFEDFAYNDSSVPSSEQIGWNFDKATFQTSGTPVIEFLDTYSGAIRAVLDNTNEVQTARLVGHSFIKGSRSWVYEARHATVGSGINDAHVFLGVKYGSDEQLGFTGPNGGGKWSVIMPPGNVEIDTGVTFQDANDWNQLKVDATDLTDIRFYIDQSRVLPDEVFGYSENSGIGSWWMLSKVGGTNFANSVVDYIKLMQRARVSLF